LPSTNWNFQYKLARMVCIGSDESEFPVQIQRSVPRRTKF